LSKYGEIAVVWMNMIRCRCVARIWGKHSIRGRSI